MASAKGDIAKKILNRSLYIIYLLTGEEYTLVRKLSKEELFLKSIKASGGGIWAQNPNAVPLLYPPIQDNTDKIREVNNQITQLLSGEVPVRCKEPVIHFSPEEWEYMEAYTDYYTDLLKKKDPQFSSETWMDHSSTAKRKLLQTFLSRTSGAAASSGAVNSAPSTSAQSSANLITEQSTSGDTSRAKVISEEDLHFPLLSPKKASETFVCPDCGASFPQKSRLKIHKKIHAPGFGRNPILADTPLPDEPLPAHKTIVHLLPCPVCDFGFTNEETLQNHLRIHEVTETDFQCLECGKVFDSTKHLSHHQTIVTAGQTYPCNVCEKSFTYSKCLHYHQRSHKGQTEFICPECGKSFTAKASLCKHRKLMHIEKLELGKNDSFSDDEEEDDDSEEDDDKPSSAN